MNNTVPFISNTKDDLHCMQSAYLMIVKYFKPDFEMEWDEWSHLTGYEEGKGTWASASLLWFKSAGFDVTHMSLFDYARFAHEGERYLLDSYGEEVGAWQAKHSNLPLEQSRADLLRASGVIKLREPTQKDLKSFLDEGHLIRCLVNSAKLNNKAGYVGHAVVVSGYDDKAFIIQDPGLPALQDRYVSYEDFEKAWAAPNVQAKELDAIKLRS
jgi:hypothetical protein